MINYFHVFIFIMSLALIKTLFLTNKNIGQILLKSLVILIILLLVLVVGLNISQPISTLIDLSSEKEKVSLSLSSFDYGDFNELMEYETDLKIYKSILENFEVTYTLKPPKSFLTTPEDIISVIIRYENDIVFFNVLSNNVLHYDDKFYKVKNKDMFNYLLDAIKDNNGEN